MTTILLIHDAWLTPRSWQSFQKRFEGAGHTVIAPAWPYMDRPIEELRASPSPEFAALRLPDIVSHYEAILKTLPEPPVIFGHGVGGAMALKLLDMGLGSAGVVLGCVPPNGAWLGLQGWRFAQGSVLSRKADALTMPYDTFVESYAPALFEKFQRQAYDTFIAPAPRGVLRDAATGHGVKVKFARRKRAPLLFVSCSQDSVTPSAMITRTYRRYGRSSATCKLVKYRHRSHLMILEQGWTEIADSALRFAERERWLIEAPQV